MTTVLVNIEEWCPTDVRTEADLRAHHDRYDLAPEMLALELGDDERWIEVPDEVYAAWVEARAAYTVAQRALRPIVRAHFDEKRRQARVEARGGKTRNLHRRPRPQEGR